MGKRSKEELKDAADSEVPVEEKKSKKHKKDRPETIDTVTGQKAAESEAEDAPQSPNVNESNRSENETICMDDFERAKPQFKKWLLECKEK